MAGILLAAIVGYFTWQRIAPSNPAYVPPSYKQITLVGEAYWAAISPDGSSLAYVSGQPGTDRALMLQDMKSGHAIELVKSTILPDLRWSPNGSELLFKGGIGDPPRRGLFLISRFGGTPCFIDKLGSHPCWSPDGTQIAVSGEKGIRLGMMPDIGQVLSHYFEAP